MKIRTSEDRLRSNKPDRSNATWNKKDQVQDNNAPSIPKGESNTVTDAELKVLKEKIAQKVTAPTPPKEPSELKASKIEWSEDNNTVKEPTSRTPWWLVSLLVLIPLGLFGWLLIAFPKKDETKSVLSTPRNPIDAEIAEMNLQPIPGPLPHIVAQNFAKTSDPAERLKLARDSERVAPLIEHFPEQARTEVTIAGQPLGEETLSGNSVKLFKSIFANGESRLLFVVQTDEGFKVDWEAYARHSNALPKWIHEARDPDFMRKDESAEVRVHVANDDYYNFRFSDEKLWRAFHLSSPDFDEHVTAYAAIDSTAAKLLTQELKTRTPMTLLLKSRNDDARNNQFEIEEVLAKGWVKMNGSYQKRWLRAEAQ